MKVRDIVYSLEQGSWHRLADDPDMQELDLDWSVTLGSVDTNFDASHHDEDQVEHYRRMFMNGQHVSPVVLVDDLLVTGAHRITAAQRAGIRSIPAYFVEVPNVD